MMFKKIIFILILSTLFLINTYTLEAKNYDEGYKDAKWGMSRKEVKECFPNMEFKESKEDIMFLSEIAGENVTVVFYFLNNKLYSVIIDVNVKTVNEEKYIVKFNKFENLLIKKYGSSDNTIRRGSDSRYVSDIEAIARGEGAYVDSWKTSESKIRLILHGDNFQPRLNIGYVCPELYEKKREKDKEESLENL